MQWPKAGALRSALLHQGEGGAPSGQVSWARLSAGIAIRGMDLNDVIDRAELNGEVARRFGNPPAPGRCRLKLDAEMAGAWSLLETAMRMFDPANAQGLVRAAAEAHRQYTAPGALRTAGFLHFIFRELAPNKQLDVDPGLTPQVEWAARVVECVRAGLGDKDFSQMIEGVSDILADLAAEAEPVSVR